jgi:glycosyltransferase involved in cell wall biosynthesis
MKDRELNIAWVIGGIGHGGVATVCRDACGAVSAVANHSVSLVSIHGRNTSFDRPAGIDLQELDLPYDVQKVADGFNAWLAQRPQDVIFLNDASYLESYWPYVPGDCAVVAVLHDIARGWRRNIVRQHACLDAVVTVAHFIERVLRKEMPAFGGILRTIHNGENFPLLPGRRESSEVLNVLYVGSLDPFKGVYDIPHIVKRLLKTGLRFRLTVVGGNAEGIRKKIESLHPGCESRWYQHIPNAECLKLMGESDVLLLPSRTEPFGMVTVEAMAMGCIPIAYDVESGSREIIENEKSGFLVPLGDYGAFADVIGRLCGDPVMLERIRSSAIARARNVFSSERMGREYAKLIDDVMVARPCHMPQRKPFTEYVAVPHKRTLYTRLVPEAVRNKVRRMVGRNPHLANALRRWRG